MSPARHVPERPSSPKGDPDRVSMPLHQTKRKVGLPVSQAPSFLAIIENQTLCAPNFVRLHLPCTFSAYPHLNMGACTGATYSSYLLHTMLLRASANLIRYLPFVFFLGIFLRVLCICSTPSLTPAVPRCHFQT